MNQQQLEMMALDHAMRLMRQHDELQCRPRAPQRHRVVPESRGRSIRMNRLRRFLSHFAPRLAERLAH